MKLKTQKAWATYNQDGSLDVVEERDVADTPVLVVPEAAVKQCKHLSIVGGGVSDALEICRKCGCWREWSIILGRWSRWQRPRILRAGR